MIISLEAAVLLQNILFTLTTCLQIIKQPKELLVDISEDCEENYTTSIHLPFGAGSADSRTILLNSANSSALFCSVLIVGPHPQNDCKDKCVTALVVEMINFHSSNFLHDGIFVKFDTKDIAYVGADMCKHDSAKNKCENLIQAHLIHAKKFTIDINFKSFRGTIKIIVTSAKYLKHYGNCTESEIYCILNGKTFCINSRLECDGNSNCGTPNLYDEYCNNLYVQDNMWFIIIYATLLTVAVMFFFIQILRQCVPKVADHFFIFNEDQEYNFVLTSQSLPPLEVRRSPDEKVIERPQRSSNATDTQIY